MTQNDLIISVYRLFISRTQLVHIMPRDSPTFINQYSTAICFAKPQNTCARYTAPSLHAGGNFHLQPSETWVISNKQLFELKAVMCGSEREPGVCSWHSKLSRRVSRLQSECRVLDWAITSCCVLSPRSEITALDHTCSWDSGLLQYLPSTRASLAESCHSAAPENCF